VSTHKKRIDKVETSLTPKQAVLLWMEESHSHGSIWAYALWLKEQPDSAYPLVRMPQQVREAVRAAMKGESREVVGRYVDSAERDVAFLFKLVYLVNARVIDDSRSTAFAFLWLLEKLKTLRGEKGKDFIKEAGAWREYTRLVMGEVDAVHGAVDAIARRYFDSRVILSPDLAKERRDTLEAWDKVIEMYNGMVEERVDQKKVKELLLDREKEWISNEPAVQTKAAFLVDLAKAEALGLLGEHERAGTLMDKYVI